MNTRKTIRAMQDKNFRDQLSENERRQLGDGPSGTVELDERLLEAVGGATGNPGCGGGTNWCHQTTYYTCNY